MWCTGIEDTFVFNPHEVTGRILDEYALTGHYDRWAEDLDLVAELGVKCARYGIPWYRIQPEKNRWDWSFADKTLGRLLDLGVDPIVDLIHYGTPAWMEQSFLNADFPKLMADYGARFAERYKGRIRWYTPMNEPRITAWYCGYLGWWPPSRRGWKGFVELTLATARGIVETDRAIAQVDPEMVSLHVDAGDLYDAGDAESETETQFRQELCF
ncbi:MAG TPA: family 1 glycosylhydrolase, partial [Fimbriimonas sp.]|nr:family 1 glycosylhydrolase [Fimbriimonas sp.]